MPLMVAATNLRTKSGLLAMVVSVATMPLP
jgi:hypothetical protein